MEAYIEAVTEKEEEGGPKRWHPSYLLKGLRHCFYFQGTSEERKTALNVLLPKNWKDALIRSVNSLLETAWSESGCDALLRVIDVIEKDEELKKQARKEKKRVSMEQRRGQVLDAFSEEPIQGSQVSAMLGYVMQALPLIEPPENSPLKEVEKMLDGLDIPAASVSSSSFVEDTLEWFAQIAETHADETAGVVAAALHKMLLFTPKGKLEERRVMCNLGVSYITLYLLYPNGLVLEGKAPSFGVDEIHLLFKDPFHYVGKHIPKNLTAWLKEVKRTSVEHVSNLFRERHEVLFASVASKCTKVFYDAALMACEILCMRSGTMVEFWTGNIKKRTPEEIRLILEKEENRTKKPGKKGKPVITAERCTAEFSGWKKAKTIALKKLQQLRDTVEALSEFEDYAFPHLPCVGHNTMVGVKIDGEWKWLRFMKSGETAEKAWKRTQLLNELQGLDMNCTRLESVEVGGKEYERFLCDDVLDLKKKVGTMVVFGPDGEENFNMFEVPDYLPPDITPESLCDAVYAAAVSGCGDWAERNFTYSNRYEKYVFLDADKASKTDVTQKEEETKEEYIRRVMSNIACKKVREMREAIIELAVAKYA